MEEVIELLVKRIVEPRELILWLNSEIQIPHLLDFEDQKKDFIHIFLNFLREEANSLLRSSSHTGLPPNKSTSNLRIKEYISPLKLPRKSSQNKSFSTKAKTLNFSEVEISNQSPIYDRIYLPDVYSPLGDSVSECNGSQNFPFKTPKKNKFSSLSLHESPISTQSIKNYNTSTPRMDQSKMRTKYQANDNCSKIKYVPADYIVTDSEKRSKKQIKKRSSVEQVLRERNCQVERTITEPEFNIEDKDAFPDLGSTSGKNEQGKKKRINPTRVATLKTSENLGSRKGENALFGVPRTRVEQNVFLQATETNIQSLDLERKLLREQRDKFQKNANDFCKPLYTNHSSLDNSIGSLCSSISSPNTSGDANLPSLSQVTSHEELNNLACVYSGLILCNLIPNVVVELYFLLQMLTIEEDFPKTTSDQSIYLNSCHNFVYFSVKTLSFLLDFLTIFDRGLVKALSENSRIIAFAPAFQLSLHEVLDGFSVARPLLFRGQPRSPILSSVSFQSDTDTQTNFTSVPAFQMFKKQRDQFYEVLRIWEDSHLTPGWTFSQGLGSKVKQILTYQSDPTNLTHFARLFQSQLLTMCKGDEQVNSSEDAEDISFLCLLKKQNPEKFKRLYERLTTPSKFGGPVPPPSFAGSQEFFKDFIVTLSSHVFNVHLANVLVMKITELNDLEWQVTDVEEKELQGDHLREEVTSTLQSLRLLAKFLGFIEFIPYQSSEPLPDHIIVNQLIIRNKVFPPLPLCDMLKDSIESGCLVVVVPWMVEMLSMVDSVALHSRCYLTIVFQFILLYKVLCSTLHNINPSAHGTCKKCAQSTSLRTISPGNCLLLKICLGWLLSLPNVPEGIFYIKEEDADINMKEYLSFKEVLFTRYKRLCTECLRRGLSPSQELDFCEGDVMSPIKPFHNTPRRSTRDMTPVKHCKDEKISPLKTPSKFLQVSMIETPEVTPNKPEEVDNGSSSLSKFVLDTFNLFDCNIIGLFCPFVHELKGILHDFTLGNIRSGGGGNIRKITPLAAPAKPTDVPEKSVQSQLEENFFHNQPSSTKKSIDFVGERIFSNVLRSIRFDIIPKLKDGCVTQLRTCVSTAMTSSPTPDKVIEIAVMQQGNELSTRVRAEIVYHTAEIIKNENLKSSLRFLLDFDITEQSLDVCCHIVCRTLNERVNGWLNSHLTSAFYIKELTGEANKYVKQLRKASYMNQSENRVTEDVSASSNPHNNSSNPALNTTLAEDPSLDLSVNVPNASFRNTSTEAANQRTTHNEDTISPSILLLEIKHEVESLMLYDGGFSESSDSSQMSESHMLHRLTSIRKTILERGDITQQVFKALERLTADWMATICVCRPKNVTKGILKEFVSLWLPSQGKVFDKTSIMSVFLSPRIVMLLGQRDPRDQKDAWSKLEEAFIEFIFSAKVLSLTQLQDSCIVLMRHIWPQSILSAISSLIRNLLDIAVKHKDFINDIDTIQFTEFAGWIMGEMENLDEFIS